MLRKEQLAELKKLLAPVRKARTELLLKSESEWKNPSGANRKQRQEFEAREKKAERQFLNARTLDETQQFLIRPGIPFKKTIQFSEREVVFAGTAQPGQALYRHSPDHVPTVIPCQYQITYGERLLRSSSRPGALAMGTIVIQLERTGQERVYLVIRNRFSWEDADKK